MTIAMDDKHGPILDVQKLSKTYSVGGGLFGRGHQSVRAVNDVSFQIRRGEVLGLVGESGSGKSTLGRTVLQLTEPTSGSVLFNGVDLTGLSRRQLKPLRPKMQLIFQDPFASLNPRMTVGRILGAPFQIQKLRLSRAERDERVVAALGAVGLTEHHLDRYPHEFSGGQRQRISIARALALEPKLIIADEPVSALDVSVQRQVLDLLEDIRHRFGLAMLFITHDLRVAAQVCDTIAVMQRGKVVEMRGTAELFAAPEHAYTRSLLAAVPGSHAS